MLNPAVPDILNHTSLGSK